MTTEDVYMWYMCLNITNCLWSTQSRTDTISHPSSRDYNCSKGQTTSATKRHNGAHDGEHFTRHASLKHRHRQTLGELLVFSDRPRFTLYHHIKTAQQYSNRWLVHWPLMGGLLHLVQRGGAWVGWGPVQSLFAVPNVTVHPSTASVPNSYYLIWQ